jgi:hypothetical protein
MISVVLFPGDIRCQDVVRSAIDQISRERFTFGDTHIENSVRKHF